MEGRYQSAARISQGMPRMADNHQKLERGMGAAFPWNIEKEHGSTDTLISGFQPPEP